MDPEESRELASVLRAASEQIGLALLDSHSAVENLGSSLERLSELLSRDLTTPAAAQEIAELRAEMARAVTGLQFYDRMAQHLLHVREYLGGTVGQLQHADGSFETLNRKLADRLLSDTHRIHLGKNLATEFLSRPPPADRSQPGDIDLF